MEFYEANSLWIGCLYHNDVSNSLSLGLKYHHLSLSGLTYWTLGQMHLVTKPSYTRLADTFVNLKTCRGPLEQHENLILTRCSHPGWKWSLLLFTCYSNCATQQMCFDVKVHVSV